jgi:hypothetical protein
MPAYFVSILSEGKTMHRIALTVDALKEMLHEILGDALEAAPEIGEREGKLVLPGIAGRELPQLAWRLTPKSSADMLMFRYFLPAGAVARATAGRGSSSELWLHWGINELNFRDGGGALLLRHAPRQPPTVVLVLPVVCYDGTVAEPVIRGTTWSACAGAGTAVRAEAERAGAGQYRHRRVLGGMSFTSTSSLKEVMEERLRQMAGADWV